MCPPAPSPLTTAPYQRHFPTVGKLGGDVDVTSTRAVVVELDAAVESATPLLAVAAELGGEVATGVVLHALPIVVNPASNITSVRSRTARGRTTSPIASPPTVTTRTVCH